MQILFVHGAFVRDGAWWWAPVAEQIRTSTGMVSAAVSLPSCGEGEVAPAAGGPGLVEDAAALTAALDGAGAAIVVAHSYGGTVTAEVGAHPAVRHVVYVSSVLPEIGTPHSAHVSPGVAPLDVEPDENGALRIVVADTPSGAAAFDARFFHDVADTSVREQAHARLCPQSPAALMTPTTRAAWQHHDSTYLVCADDRSTSPVLQREHAARATHVVELPTSHHPFQSRPDLVAAAVAGVISATRPSA